ncbi:MAG: isochorismatase family protein [Trebonia sp.]
MLLLIDLQERLMPAIHDGDAVVARAARVAQAAKLLDVPVRATEQYPAGLGDAHHPRFREVQQLLK